MATSLTTVVACRCTPTQKADVATLIRTFTKKRVCCIGDGGNDVSMIQAADVGMYNCPNSLNSSSKLPGIGIVGKEGRQASLAADFSITQFSFLTKLLVWHGRNSYKRSAKLAQFVIHRGLIISIMQAVFSSIFYFAPIALYQGWLLVRYYFIVKKHHQTNVSRSVMVHFTPWRPCFLWFLTVTSMSLWLCYTQNFTRSLLR